MNFIKIFLPVIISSLLLSSNNNNEVSVTVKPAKYDKALRNPLKGFTTRGINSHPWATTAHDYIRWNQIENHESDGIEKIIKFCNNQWDNIASTNTKVIPRVYLHWDGNQKHWPEDMQEDDYSSEQFKARVVRLIERLGIVWDNDPRVAFVEMGIIGKWGEHHSPSPSGSIQKLLGEAFTDAFKNKKVSVRHFWNTFTNYQFGEYWDSWAHYDQMWGHGNSIKQLNEQTGRYKETYIGGEVAYNWGNSDIQPGPSPTASLAEEKHRNFVINSIRWLHCTQLRWIDAYNKNDTDAIEGAEEMQKAFGYRYVLDEVRFSLEDSLKISFDVTNTGSAPFYYEWPVEVALLDSTTHEPVWKATMDRVDIGDWLPGEGWTDPEWKYVGSWQEYHPNENWNPSATSEWATPPALNEVEDKFKVDIADGTYILSISILDPAGDLPAVKFATGNYLNGGRHPIGLVSVGQNKCDTLPADFQFDDPQADNSLYYDDDFEIIYDRDPKQSPYRGTNWRFPTDTVFAWQYDYMDDFSGEKFFYLDSANTVGVYGCNDTSGLNIRSYQDSIQYDDAAQFNWDPTAETFQKHGQWIEYTADFKLNLPYQLLLRARNNVDANFKFTVLTLHGDTVFFRDFNLKNDFDNMGGGNDQTDWFLSKIPVKEPWGTYVVRFDWYDKLGEPGIFGGFTFIQSELDATPPEWQYVDIGTFTPGTNITVMTSEDATVYMVPDETSPDTTTIRETSVAVVEVSAFSQAKLSTSGLDTGDYVVYAIDGSNNISEASRVIQLQYPVNAEMLPYNLKLTVLYNKAQELIEFRCTSELERIAIYNILGKNVGNAKCNDKTYDFQANGFSPGVYLIKVLKKNGTLSTKKMVIN